MYYSYLFNRLDYIIYSIFFSKLCLHNSIEFFQFILHIHVALLRKHKIITPVSCNKYYVMNYSINSFTGASEALVNVVVVY